MDKVLILRTVAADLTSHGGFKWPESGPVECSDWDPVPRCGGGLHGLLWGEGNGNLLDWGSDAKWLVVEAYAEQVVDIDGEKVKVPRGAVIYCGNRQDAIQLIADHPEGRGRAIVGFTATAGNCGTATAGNCGTATAGYDGTATAGNRGTVQIRYWDSKAKRYRIRTGYIGEDGLQANTAYTLDEENQFTEKGGHHD